jgi:DNA ligase (NAD+)
LLALPRFAEKSVDNLLSAIEKARRVTLARVLASLSIPQVGEETAYDIARHFGSIEKIVSAKYEEMEAIYGVGPIVAQSLFDWFVDKENRKLIKNLFKQIEIKEEVVGQKLAGKSFVFTGTINIGRVEAQELVRKLGGEVSSLVSKNTSFVVAGENAGSKLDKANELGVKVVTEREFLEMVK